MSSGRRVRTCGVLLLFFIVVVLLLFARVRFCVVFRFVGVMETGGWDTRSSRLCVVAQKCYVALPVLVLYGVVRYSVAS